MAWYIGHSLVMRRLSEEVRRRDGEGARPRAHTQAPVPDRRRLYADMAVLFRRDLANVEAGLYPLPEGTTVAVGGTLSVTAAGLGAVDAEGKVVAPVTAKLGDLDAVVETAVLPEGADGVYQLSIKIPEGASGAMPLTVTQKEVVSNAITVSIQ